MAKKNWNRVTAIIFIGLCVLWICYGYYKSSHLIKNYKLTIGQVNHISPPGAKNNSRGISYEYIINEKKFTGFNGIKVCDNYSIYDLSSLIVNQKFHVAYDSTNNSSSIIILTVHQAKKFDAPITDKLLHYDSIINCMETSGNY